MISDSRHTNMHNKTFTVFLLAIFLIPWPHGGELTIEILPFVFVISILLCVLLIKAPYVLQENSKTIKQIKIPLTFFTLWIILSFLQAINLPSSLVHFLSPTVATINIDTKSLTDTLSISPSLSLMETLQHISYLGTFLLALTLLNNSKRVEKLATTMFLSSALMALYSLINQYTNGSIAINSAIAPWKHPWSIDTYVSGAISYKNHYASFLAMTIPLGIGLIYRKLKTEKYDFKQQNKVFDIIGFLSSINILYLLSLTVMITTLLKTTSRGGILAFLVGITLTLITLISLKNKKISSKKISTLIIGFIFLAVIAIFSGASDNLISRVESVGFNQHGRDHLRNTTLDIFADYPIFGSGPGTYSVILDKYKPFELGNSQMWSRGSHNDYLELLASHGVIGFLLLGSALLILFAKVALGLRKQHSSLFGIQISCYCGIIIIMASAALDFNFQLPVNAIYFYLLLAMAIKIPLLKRSKERSNQ